MFTIASNGIVTRWNFIFDLFDRSVTKIREAVFLIKRGVISRYRKYTAVEKYFSATLIVTGILLGL